MENDGTSNQLDDDHRVYLDHFRQVQILDKNTIAAYMKDSSFPFASYDGRILLSLWHLMMVHAKTR